MRGNQVDGREPLLKTDFRIFKDSSNLNRKLALALRALVSLAIVVLKYVIVTTFIVRTNNLATPADQFQIITANLLIFKVSEQVYKGLKFTKGYHLQILNRYDTSRPCGT